MSLITWLQRQSYSGHQLQMCLNSVILKKKVKPQPFDVIDSQGTAVAIL